MIRCKAKLSALRRRGRRRVRWSDSITDSMDMNLSKLQETVGDREAWCAVAHGVTKTQTWLGNWTTTDFTNAELLPRITFQLSLYYINFCIHIVIQILRFVYFGLLADTSPRPGPPRSPHPPGFPFPLSGRLSPRSLRSRLLSLGFTCLFW